MRHAIASLVGLGVLCPPREQKRPRSRGQLGRGMHNPGWAFLPVAIVLPLGGYVWQKMGVSQSS